MAWSMRTTSSRTLVGCGMDEMNWLVPRFGWGKVPAFSSRTAFWSIRFAGMILPGNGWPIVKPSAVSSRSLFGSVVAGTIGAVPPEGTVYANAAPAVGKLLAAMVFTVVGELPWISLRHSSFTKKNVLLRELL